MPISTPTQIAVPFATSGLKNPIPAASDPVTGKAGYDQGFTAINMTPRTAGGIPPYGQDMNGIFFDISTALQFLEAGGSFPYSSAFATAVGGYPLGALVSRTDGSGLWRNTVANNTTDPEAFGAGWQPEDAGNTAITMTNANVTLTALQAARSIITITGALTASLNLIFPTYKKQWLVVNNCTGAFSVTCKTASGSGVAIATGASLQVYGDGANIAGALTSSLPIVGSSLNTKMAIATASATATFTADSVMVGRSLSGSKYLLTSLSLSINVSTTGAGGMDTGSAPVSGYVAIYAIYNPTTATSALLGVNATSVAAPNIYGGANMPSGYTASALISIWPTNGTGQMVIGSQVGRDIYYVPVTLLNTTSPVTTRTSLSITGGVPPGAKKVHLNHVVIETSVGIGVELSVMPTSTGIAEVVVSAAVTAQQSKCSSAYSMIVVTSQTIFYAMASLSAGQFIIISRGYEF